MGAMEQMAKSLETLKGRQKEYSARVNKLHLIEGWWWDSTQFQPRPDQPTQPTTTALGTATWDFDYAKFTGDKNKPAQELHWPLNHSNNLYQAGGIVPKFIGGLRPDHSPMLSYRWDVVRDTLNRLRKEAGSPYDGIIVEFVNPATGGPVGPTMSICAQLLRPGEKTQSHRQNINTIYIGVEGRGYTVAGDQRIEWRPHDVFCVPSWHW